MPESKPRRLISIYLAVLLLLLLSSAAAVTWFVSLLSLDTRARMPGPPALVTFIQKHRNTPVHPLLRPTTSIDTPELRTARRRFNVIYNDVGLSDSARAQLIFFLNSTVRTGYWRLVHVGIDESIEHLISATYGITSITNEKSEGSLIQTIYGANCTDAQGGELGGKMYPVLPDMSREAQRALVSHCVSGRDIRVLPLPVRASAAASKHTGALIRVAEPTSDSIRAIHNTRNLDLIAPSGLSVLEEPENVSATVVVLGTMADIQERMKQVTTPYIAPPPGARLFRTDGLIDVVLQDAANRCPADTESWVASMMSSPAIAQVRQVLQTNAVLRSSVISRANSSKLVLVDWVDAALPHGLKVKSVVDLVVGGAYGLNELVSSKAIQLIDLNPKNRNNTAALLKALTDYHSDYHVINPTESQKDSVIKTFNCSESWIRNGGVPCSGVPAESQAALGSNVVEVDQLVFEAVLWEYLKVNPAWMNISFGALQPEGGITEQLKSISPVIFAADRDDNGEENCTLPQCLSTDVPTVLNVTWGLRDGTVLGGFTSTKTRPAVIVSVMAPGCGYSNESIAVDDAGASFAAPFVAAFSWVEFLRTSGTPTEIRDRILKSSNMFPNDRLAIESSGAFDPALLVEHISSWLTVGRSGAEEIVGGAVELTYQDDEGNALHDSCSTAMRCSVLLYMDHSQLQAIVSRRPRGIILSGSTAYEVLQLSVTSMSCDLKTSTGQIMPLCKSDAALKDAESKTVQIAFRGPSH
jgi:hypothetical protein